MALCMMLVSVQCISAFATADSLAKLEEDVTAFDGKLSVAEPDETREQAKLRRKAMKEASKQRNIYGNERERKEKEATMAARALDREQRQQQKKLRKAK